MSVWVFVWACVRFVRPGHLQILSRHETTQNSCPQGIDCVADARALASLCGGVPSQRHERTLTFYRHRHTCIKVALLTHRCSPRISHTDAERPCRPRATNKTSKCTRTPTRQSSLNGTSDLLKLLSFGENGALALLMPNKLLAARKLPSTHQR